MAGLGEAVKHGDIMPAPRGLVQQIDQSLHREMLLPRGARLVVAVSGGADSVALLRLLHRINESDFWHWTLVVAHVDHGIRGAASRADARFVAALARGLGLPCVVKRLHLKRTSSEDAARQARFRALAQICRARQCAGVVMAHHADDQAETVLMRIFRGTAIQGLGGMAACSQVGGMTIFRPLITVRRAALRQYLRALGQPWCEDATNATDQYLRNRVRRQLMPRIEKIWPKAVDALGRLAALAGETHDFVEAAARRAMDEIPAWRQRRRIQIPRAALTQMSPAVASEVLRQIIAALGGTADSADFERLRELTRLLASAEGGKTIELPGGIRISCNAGLIRFQRTASGGWPVRGRRRIG
jgi:tRNA(Ile)-lysidine synthase